MGLGCNWFGALMTLVLSNMIAYNEKRKGILFFIELFNQPVLFFSIAAHLLFDTQYMILELSSSPITKNLGEPLFLTKCSFSHYRM